MVPQQTAPDLPEDEYLSHKELHQLHGILRGQLDAFMAAARADLNDLGQVREVEADAIDFASTETDREQRLRFADRERKLAGKIRVALQRMQEGEYGVCESCGEPITFKRLLARPIATQCIDCKTQAEQLERRSRVY